MRKQYGIWIFFTGILLILLAVSVFLSLSVGEVFYTPGRILELIFSGGDEMDVLILKRLRMPRMFMGFFVGASLSLSGVILQGIFRNPLVEPYTLGISGGASVGVSLALVFSLGASLGGFLLPVAGFSGALATVFLVYVFSIRRGGVRISVLLLSGVMVSFIASSLTMLLLALSGREHMHNIMFWVMGSLTETDSRLIGCIAVLSLAGLLFSLFQAGRLNVMRLGIDRAKELGVDTDRTIRYLFVLTSLLAGICVSVAGVIGFVGLIIPRLMRYFVGSDYRILIFSSFLGGGIFLLLSDILARILICPNELPIGVVTGIIGGTVFMFVMARSHLSKRENSE